ncbi:peptide-N4-asparagine amidase [Phytomonospora sp. NPDC050363]|uniref:peptide-N4-asparagine amidase n=1 Tax=Phytomonospora sp. NPDC050363 TaxID=3155642 RepID=UPI0033FF80AC
MRLTQRALTIAGVAVLTVAAAASPALAAEPPAEFGSDWDDPRTAVAPIEKPDTPSCEIQLVDYEFRDFTPFEGTYTPPADCAGDWSKVVLRLEGAVAGRQYDRLGALTIGEVPVFKTSTPEPSVDGIAWTVESDLTEYSALLRSPQPTWMLIGNVVNDTYTGVLDVQVYLTFYTADRHHPAPPAADTVTPLSNVHKEDGVTVGDVTLPRNSEKLIADVYATGSGGGCEEFWYFTAPAEGYSCPNPEGPYREVQVLVDGELAGIAAPFPHVYTGGWSNPYLWYTLPAPRAFDVRPISYDLTPFLGLLNDGRTHQVTVQVVGVQPGQSGWDTPVGLRSWQDEDSTVVRGRLITSRATDLANTSTHTADGDDHRVNTKGSHRLTTIGSLKTSHGTVVTTVDRRVANEGVHSWGAGENPDGVTATWTDETSLTQVGGGFPVLESSRKTFTMDGVIAVDSTDRLTTTLTIGDAEEFRSFSTEGLTATNMSDVHTGEAGWNISAPRPERHAMGVSEHHYALSGTEGCYDRRIATRNGYVTADEYGC